ncbi:hypothetical protein [Burkholderia gladioli]|uniref:hypothetical protein n=1 Tax=Burkholderia gladioli TaxID=28095 RepID=UPI0012FBB8AB|nr:hypothetical protein [Burkholderia gladioli]
MLAVLDENEEPRDMSSNGAATTRTERLDRFDEVACDVTDERGGIAVDSRRHATSTPLVRSVCQPKRLGIAMFVSRACEIH